MKYLGSKNKYAKEILPLILKNRKPDQCFVEPFCGGCNITDKVANPRVANDVNSFLISMWRKLVEYNWIPPDYVSEEEYYNIKKDMLGYPPELVGFVGFNGSFGGKWWGGYARGKDSKGNPRNYLLEGKKNIMKQIPKLKGVWFTNDNYLSLSMPDNSIIYCDPPYKGTTKYKDVINYNRFWEWTRQKSREGHTVFISEYAAPDDFTCIWQKEVNCDLTKNDSKRTEKLFRFISRDIY